MRIVRDFLYVEPEDREASVAIGNFDGVHLGHQSVIDLARQRARELACPLGVITFEPHPRSYFAPNAPAFRLMSAAARANRLEKLNVDLLYELNFNAALSSLSAHEFAREVIVKGFGLKHVVVGADFYFGKGRSGNSALLVEMGAEMGFGVTVAPLISGLQGEFSSTNIRQALGDGKPEIAAQMLGHWHRIDGNVIGGDQRGRDLGYPTANLALGGLHLPKFGVYAVLVDVLEGPHSGHYLGAASIGLRPTFGGETPNLEVFIFDFSGDIYETPISVALVAFQRPELKFDTLKELITQIDADCVLSREILANIEA
ncbi:MAG: bifunctional riboflavin kinase/FAD synthetase [Alphaproteobacteria bacterium]|nr:bifunctional riboflavin kinase/FAD synthetase [Alphaproteobacteria bacterium]